MGHSLEGKTRKRRENETAEESERLDNAYVFIERYEREKEPFMKLWSLKFRFIAIFGKEMGKPFDETRITLNRIFIAANRLGERHWKDQGYRQFTDHQLEKHPEEMDKNEKIIWVSLDETDEIANHINNCIIKIETHCAEIINK